MITTTQVLKATGLKSVRTLQRWRERNIVPPPQLQPHANGRGMTGMWPAWIVHHIRAIKQRLAAGETLEDVARTLSGDWDAEATKWRRKRPDVKKMLDRAARDEATRSFSEWASEVLYGFLRAVGVARPGRIDDKIADAVSRADFVDEVIKLLRQGFTPVMLLTKDGVKVVPDFLLSSFMSTATNNGQPLLVVPIRNAFVEAFADVDPKLSNEPRYVPAKLIEDRTHEKARTRRYRLKGQWGFTIEK